MANIIGYWILGGFLGIVLTLVLGKEIGPHNATAAPGTSLAEDHTAYPVSFVCPGLPLSAW